MILMVFTSGYLLESRSLMELMIFTLISLTMIYIVNDINGIYLGVSFGVEEFDGVNDIYINGIYLGVSFGVEEFDGVNDIYINIINYDIYIVNDINGIYLGVSFGVEEFDGVEQQLGDGGSFFAGLSVGEEALGEPVEEHAAGDGEGVQGVLSTRGP